MIKKHSNTMDNVYENIDDYKPTSKRKILVAFDNRFPDIMTNKNFKLLQRELFTRCRKLNISLVFISQSYILLFQKNLG